MARIQVQLVLRVGTDGAPDNSSPSPKPVYLFEDALTKSLQRSFGDCERARERYLETAQPLKMVMRGTVFNETEVTDRYDTRTAGILKVIADEPLDN